jgi:hypothetical protein
MPTVVRVDGVSPHPSEWLVDFPHEPYDCQVRSATATALGLHACEPPACMRDYTRQHALPPRGPVWTSTARCSIWGSLQLLS